MPSYDILIDHQFDVVVIGAGVRGCAPRSAAPRPG